MWTQQLPCVLVFCLSSISVLNVGRSKQTPLSTSVYAFIDWCCSMSDAPVAPPNRKWCRGTLRTLTTAVMDDGRMCVLIQSALITLHFHVRMQEQLVRGAWYEISNEEEKQTAQFCCFGNCRFLLPHVPSQYLTRISRQWINNSFPSLSKLSGKISHNLQIKMHVIVDKLSCRDIIFCV